MPNTNGTRSLTGAKSRGEGAKVLPKSLNRKQVLACALHPAGLPAPFGAVARSRPLPLYRAEISQKLQWKLWAYPLENRKNRISWYGTNSSFCKGKLLFK
ncbi:hypothetical protein M5D96_009747 [Drosophila gunungcola]|uniref:Uncharacterized protein n=1 Tax=Drosophila gunungcola TaxID=103775 RepID=A0A9Q0BM61_9MUSC|nr:hypothetical protein M5D96_009747 [Drosophila gunungcola]